MRSSTRGSRFEHRLKTLADYTNPALMVPSLRNRTAETVIAELCTTLEVAGLLAVPKAFYDAVLARELMSPTSFLAGWALPHARLKELPALSFALGRSLEPVRWLGAAAAPVQMVILFAVAEFEAKAYLNLIAGVARLSQNLNLVEQLRQAGDKSAMVKVLEQIPLREIRSAVSNLSGAAEAC
jgi:mannitol/fructose-specific phosphotransferase system IIA component (Ntr-type)